MLTNASSVDTAIISRGASMITERDEVKYLIAPGGIERVAKTLDAHLPRHHFGDLSDDWYFVTTVYFDTVLREQYRSALENSERNLKMRAKEYEDGDRHASHRRFWIELKSKDGLRTGKQRLDIPKTEVPAFFPQGSITAETFEAQRSTYGAESDSVLRDLAEYCRGFEQPMRPDCLVHYRRLPWQHDAGALRVTLDLDLTYYAARTGIWNSDRALTREILGVPRGSESAGVLEVKSLVETPAWLDALFAEIGARPTVFSKFEQASAAVHGR